MMALAWPTVALVALALAFAALERWRVSTQGQERLRAEVERRFVSVAGSMAELATELRGQVTELKKQAQTDGLRKLTGVR